MFVSDKTAFPDETYVAPFEELFDLHNNILLNSLEQENPNRLELAGIIGQTSSEDPENELNEIGPKNCQGGNNRVDRPARLSPVCFSLKQSFALTSISLRECPFLYEMSGFPM